MKMPAGPDIARLYDEHAQPLYAFLLNFAREPNLLRGIRDERAFLIRLAHNAAIDLIRRRGTREKTKENFAAENLSVFAPTENPDEQFFRDELSAALGELPEEQRAVVHLKLWSGLTFEQIAAALNLSPNTAASRYRYGLDKLRARLRPLYEEMKKAE